MQNNGLPANVEDSLYCSSVDVCIAVDGDLVICNTFVSGFGQMDNAKLQVSEVFVAPDYSIDEIESYQEWMNNRPDWYGGQGRG